jgi:hypothetical protein
MKCRASTKSGCFVGTHQCGRIKGHGGLHKCGLVSEGSLAKPINNRPCKFTWKKKVPRRTGERR